MRRVGATAGTFQLSVLDAEYLLVDLRLVLAELDGLLLIARGVSLSSDPQASSACPVPHGVTGGVFNDAGNRRLGTRIDIRFWQRIVIVELRIYCGRSGAVSNVLRGQQTRVMVVVCTEGSGLSFILFLCVSGGGVH